MKNIQNTTKDLELFNSKGTIIYKFTSKVGYSSEHTYDANGNQLTHRNSHGYSSECTYNNKGKILTHTNSNGYSCKYTRDENGKELTYENSDGERRGFNIPEYTMQQLVEKLGNFKIII